MSDLAALVLESIAKHSAARVAEGIADQFEAIARECTDHDLEVLRLLFAKEATRRQQADRASYEPPNGFKD